MLWLVNPAAEWGGLILLPTSALHVEMKGIVRNEGCSYTIHVTGLFIILLDFSEHLVEPL